jgi:hypothetical protein
MILKELTIVGSFYLYNPFFLIPASVPYGIIVASQSFHRHTNGQLFRP